MSGTPSLFASNNVPIALRPISKRQPSDAKLTEQYFQRAVHHSPNLLPYREFFPSARGIVSLGMEVPLSFPGGKSGSIDNLFLTDDGHLVVLEMKLWRNPQAVREVVGQIFQYGLTLSGMRLPGIEDVLRKASNGTGRLHDKQTLIEYAVEHLDIKDEHAFSNALEKHLRSGELLYLIAGDGIHVSVDAIGDWINASSGAPFHFGLLELDAYETDDKQRLIVPRLRVKTKEIGRHVIEVTVGGTQPELANVQIKEQLLQSTGAIRESRRLVATDHSLLTLEALQALIQSKNVDDPEALETALYLLHGLQDNGFDSRPLATEMSFGVRDTSGADKFVSLINLGAKYLHLQEPFKKDDASAMKGFRERANQLMEFYDPNSLDDKSKFSREPAYAEVAACREALLKFIVEERNIAAKRLEEPK